jgi:hypothetical protein
MTLYELTKLTDEQFDASSMPAAPSRHVGRLREQLKPVHLETAQDRPRTAHRGGTTYTQNTAAIGKSSRQPDPDIPPELPLVPGLPPQVYKGHPGRQPRPGAAKQTSGADQQPRRR